MTRNNLDVHISWLFSKRATPPVGVQSRLVEPAVAGGLEDFGISAEDLEGVVQDELGSISSPVRNRQVLETSFTRPSVPLPAANARSKESSRPKGPEVMGKHGSNHKSAASSVMSQYQLATPASTTASTIGTSSLTQGYANFLRKDNGGTPSSRPTTERPHSKLMRTLQAPQTPRQTPQTTIEPTLRTMDSVDLTGDITGEDEVSRSSSTEIVFSDPKVVWTPSAAARPEPLPRTSKKRKSDDLARSSTKKRTIKSPAKSRRNDLSLDGFMDIDDMIPFRPQPERPNSRLRKVHPTVEPINHDDDIEEIKVTETIFRTETRTRKSISRVPSMSEGVPGRRKVVDSDELLLPPPGPSPSGSSAQARAKIQVARSPTSKIFSQHGESTPSPQKHSKHEKQTRIIQDSDEDDDEMILDDIRASCSPHLSVRSNAKVMNLFNSSERKGSIPDFESKPEIDHNYRNSVPRTASPLRTISKNVADRVVSPSKHSSSRAIFAPARSTLVRGHTAQSSTLTTDDKIAVNQFLSNPSSIATYHNRIKFLKSQSSEECMAYTDNSEVVPPKLKDERIRILDMEKSYQKLEQLSSNYQSLKSEKKNIARQISELLDLDIDSTQHEERQSAITRDMREYERDICDLLHASGAIKDGFGTEMQHSSQQIAPNSFSKTQDGVHLTMGSSAIGSAQVILQTQFPSFQQTSTLSSQPMQDNLPLRPSPRRDVVKDARPSRYQSSPSPVRRPIHAVTEPEISIRQAPQGSFFQAVSPENYEVDDAAYFNDIMIEEAENEKISRGSNRIPDNVEDNYGDSDDDGFLEVAEIFENLPSRPETTKGSVSNTSLRTPGNQLQQKRQAEVAKDMYQQVDPAHAGMLDHPWSKEVKKGLRERFHLRGFRQNQLEAINATLAGKDVFVLMPTGGGKSLCYQLPAIVRSGKTRGVTIVISPLLSLMSDQVDHLRDIHIQAFLVNGEQAKEERDLVFNALGDPHPDQYIQVLYITPEMIGKSNQLINALKRLHQKKRLARIVIDEAHCVSQWGHDFRPDYKTLVNLRATFSGVPFMALTATATENVKADCIHNLGMEGCKELKQSFNRPNLHYEIRPKSGKGAGAATVDTMIDLILNKYKNQTGIVYTLSRKKCEELANRFQRAGIEAHHFHASMQPEEKSRVQRAWQAGEYQVVVATIAFGMGIDKPNVRFVIHHTIPKSLEGYYQETGRAGRDGKPSGCYLFYGYQDTAVLRRFIDDGEGEADVKEMQRQMLNRMVQFCENRNDCRRANILAYFGESFPKENCNNSCDNCSSGAIYETVDMTELAKTALKIIKALEEQNVTLLYVVDILRGSKANKIKPEHRTIGGHGCAKHLIRGEVERLFTRLLMDNVLVEKNVLNKGGFVTPYLGLGPAAPDFTGGNRRLKLPVKVSKSPLAAARPIPERKAAVPTSTLFTSPVSPSSRKSKGKDRAEPPLDLSDEDDDFLVNDDDASEEDAFEPQPRREPTSRRRGQETDLGPPITKDGRMDQISDLHRDVVEAFVGQAKKVEEGIRNKNNHNRRYFSEADFREMAINWTLTLDMMKEIPGIDQEKVARYGCKFMPLITKFHADFEQMMGRSNDRDMDENHQNVIDLCSDNDEDDAEDDAEDVEQHSRYFVPPEVQLFNQQIALAQQRPQKRHEKAEPPKQSFRGGSRGRGGKNWSSRKHNRRSNESIGSSSSRSKTSGRLGVAKKSFTARKATGNLSKKNAGASASGSNVIEPFRRTNGGGGGGSSGIMGMPI